MTQLIRHDKISEATKRHRRRLVTNYLGLNGHWRPLAVIVLFQICMQTIDHVQLLTVLQDEYGVCVKQN